MEIDRKEQRKLQQRQEILDAAEQVFAHQGFHGATMDAVADQCGWSKGTLYLHFENKEDLFFSLLISKIEEISALVIAELEMANSLQEVLEKLIDVQFDFFMKNKDFFQLTVAEQGKVLQNSTTGMREKMLEQQMAYFKRITELASRSIREDSPVSPIAFTQSVSGAIHIHMMAWLMQPETVNLESLRAELKELYLNGILQYEKS